MINDHCGAPHGCASRFYRTLAKERSADSDFLAHPLVATGHLVPADTHLSRQYRSSPVSAFCRVIRPCSAHSRGRWTVESAVQKVFCCSRRTTFCESGLLPGVV